MIDTWDGGFLAGIVVGIIVYVCSFFWFNETFELKRMQVERAEKVCMQVDSTPISFDMTSTKCENGLEINHGL